MSLKDGENIGRVEREIETWRTVFSRKTKKQSSVALSSVEAEYMAMCQAAKEAVWLTGLLNIELRSPLIIFSDSQGALALAQNTVFHPRSKHIAIQYHFTRELVQNNQSVVQYIPTEPWWRMSSPRRYPNPTADETCQLEAWTLWAAWVLIVRGLRLAIVITSEQLDCNH